MVHNSAVTVEMFHAYTPYIDIYIAKVSSTHNVCAKDVYIAIVSTIVETSNPEQEIAPGLQLLGPIYEKYVLSVLATDCGD